MWILPGSILEWHFKFTLGLFDMNDNDPTQAMTDLSKFNMISLEKEIWDRPKEFNNQPVKKR